MTAPLDGLPLCGGGRCSALLTRIAELKLVDRVVAANVDALEFVVRTALHELGRYDYSDRDVKAAVVAGIQALLAGGPDAAGLDGGRSS